MTGMSFQSRGIASLLRKNVSVNVHAFLWHFLGKGRAVLWRIGVPDELFQNPFMPIDLVMGDNRVLGNRKGHFREKLIDMSVANFSSNWSRRLRY